jgi:DNA polymerase III alpha subunit
LDLNDEKVYKMIRDGHTTGIFQIEGYGKHWRYC